MASKKSKNKKIANGIVQECLMIPIPMSYWLLLADVSALYSQCDWRVNVISRLDYDWQTGMSGTHLIFIALARESCWHTGFCKWATDTFLIVFCLIRVGLGRSGAADNGKLQTVLIDLQSFDFREFKPINFYTVFRIGLRWGGGLKKKQWMQMLMTQSDHHKYPE